MEATAKAKYLRSSTNRMRQVADMIRGKSVETASAILLSRSSARVVTVPALMRICLFMTT